MVDKKYCDYDDLVMLWELHPLTRKPFFVDSKKYITHPMYSIMTQKICCRCLEEKVEKFETILKNKSLHNGKYYCSECKNCKFVIANDYSEISYKTSYILGCLWNNVCFNSLNNDVIFYIDNIHDNQRIKNIFSLLNEIDVDFQAITITCVKIFTPPWLYKYLKNPHLIPQYLKKYWIRGLIDVHGDITIKDYSITFKVNISKTVYSEILNPPLTQNNVFKDKDCIDFLQSIYDKIDYSVSNYLDVLFQTPTLKILNNGNFNTEEKILLKSYSNGIFSLKLDKKKFKSLNNDLYFYNTSINFEIPYSMNIKIINTLDTVKNGWFILSNDGFNFTVTCIKPTHKLKFPTIVDFKITTVNRLYLQ